MRFPSLSRRAGYFLLTSRADFSRLERSPPRGDSAEFRPRRRASCSRRRYDSSRTHGIELAENPRELGIRIFRIRCGYARTSSEGISFFELQLFTFLSLTSFLEKPDSCVPVLDRRSSRFSPIRLNSPGSRNSTGFKSPSTERLEASEQSDSLPRRRCERNQLIPQCKTRRRRETRDGWLCPSGNTQPYLIKAADVYDAQRKSLGRCEARQDETILRTSAAGHSQRSGRVRMRSNRRTQVSHSHRLAGWLAGRKPRRASIYAGHRA